MTIEIAIYKRDRNGNKTNELAVLKTSSGEDAADFFNKHTVAPMKERQKSKKKRKRQKNK